MKRKDKKRIIFLLLFGTFLCCSAYFVCSYDGFSLISDVKASNNDKILNQKYNSSLEGSVLDNIFDFNARILYLNQPNKILHKEVNPNNGIYGIYNGSKFHKQSNVMSNNIKIIDDVVDISNIQNANPDYTIIAFDNNTKKSSVINEYYKSNRFEGLLSSVKTEGKHVNPIVYNTNKDISSWKYQNYSNSNTLTSLTLKGRLGNKFFSNKILNYPNSDSTINNNLIAYSSNKFKSNIDIVKKFSNDPLESIISNVLIPSGLPKTPANVNAIAKGMGLPSGALSSSDALASSLGLTIKELSNPNTKLSTKTIMSINSNKFYVGHELDLNNTTLADYYSQALKNNFFSGLNFKRN